MRKLLIVLVIIALLAIAGTTTYLILRTQNKAPTTTDNQTAETQDTITNETEQFYKYKSSDVVKVFTEAQLPISDVKNQEIGGTAAPATEVESQSFVIDSIAPDGGQILVFDSEEGLNAKKVWFERFPDLAPYVYIKGNIIVQLNSGLPTLEARKYQTALENLQ